MASEFDFIDWIKTQQTAHDAVKIGIGDDLAALDWNADDLLLVGVDQVLDGVHFDSSIHSPESIGRKAMNRNLSDCAAMACLPAAAVVSVALPRDVPNDYAKRLFLGLKSAADVFNFPIVGGDTGSWPGKLAMSVTILGRSAGVTPITRGGAKPGDGIYVTGPLGGSMRGRHMTFIPRIDIGRMLGEQKIATAMIDLSDGLSRDIRHICKQSNVGAIIDAASIPIHEDAIEMRRDGHSPLEHALHDGEDYELLFTAAPTHRGFNRFGTITADMGIFIESHGEKTPLELLGWEHQF